MANKIISYLIGLIIFALAGEGGYYLGVNAGKRIGAKEALINQNQQKAESIKSSPIIPVANKRAAQWIEQIGTIPIAALWKSDWVMTIGGKFISMDNNSITLDINGTSKKIFFPIPSADIESLKFSQFDQGQKQYIPDSISLQEFKTGDAVSVNISIETITGKTKLFELIKRINL